MPREAIPDNAAATFPAPCLASTFAMCYACGFTSGCCTCPLFMRPYPCDAVLSFPCDEVAAIGIYYVSVRPSR